MAKRFRSSRSIPLAREHLVSNSTCVRLPDKSVVAVVLIWLITTFTKMSDSTTNKSGSQHREGGFHSWLILAASSLIFCLNGSVFFTQGENQHNFIFKHNNASELKQIANHYCGRHKEIFTNYFSLSLLQIFRYRTTLSWISQWIWERRSWYSLDSRCPEWSSTNLWYAWDYRKSLKNYS